MQITDCKWELDNLGVTACEVNVGPQESRDAAFLREIAGYQYQVVKVESGNPGMNSLLEENGFRLVETQIEVELRQKDFNYEDRLIAFLAPDVSFRDVETQDQFDALLQGMTPDMFVSDRIAQDPHFGLEAGCRRYRNWMRTAFAGKTASFYQILYKGEPVGFSMYRVKDGLWHGDLGGIYPAAGRGLGLLTAAAAFLYMKDRGMKGLKLVSCISANNTPVLSAFNHCHYNFRRFKYVFVLHRL